VWTRASVRLPSSKRLRQPHLPRAQHRPAPPALSSLCMWARAGVNQARAALSGARSSSRLSANGRNHPLTGTRTRCPLSSPQAAPYAPAPPESRRSPPTLAPPRSGGPPPPAAADPHTTPGPCADPPRFARAGFGALLSHDIWIDLTRGNLLELELLVPVLVRGSVGGNRGGDWNRKIQFCFDTKWGNRGTTFMVMPVCCDESMRCFVLCALGLHMRCKIAGWVSDLSCSNQ
jgi:hypothetical protein